MRSKEYGKCPVPGGWTASIILPAIAVPIPLMGEAVKFPQFLVPGLSIDLAGGSFCVVDAHAARWFERRRRGVARGAFGAGNSGAAAAKFAVPARLGAYGRSITLASLAWRCGVAMLPRCRCLSGTSPAVRYRSADGSWPKGVTL